MISLVKLENFKCFQTLSLEMKPLTLLTGRNGVGKSAIMESLLALMQSRWDVLSLNGRLINLIDEVGDAQDVYCNMGIGPMLIYMDEPYRFDTSVYAGFRTSMMSLDKGIALPPARDVIPVGCDKIPAYLPMNENRLSLLHAHQELLFHNVPIDVMNQMRAWMNLIKPDAPLIHGEPFSHTCLIVLACLSATLGSTLLIEYPELYRHGQSQTQMGLFLSAVACTGVQIIIETHSDHILNGCRIAAKRKIIPSESVAVHYLRRVPGGVEALSPKLNKDGRFDNWPEGFFDEWEHALDHLLGIKE
jgi:hypothetical protein